MSATFLRELMNVYSRDGRGYFAMLECYLDDSGTHDSSTAILWGGVMGHQHYMGLFENAWKDRLQSPCEGKPPIKKFHSAELANGWGEFEGYNSVERDRARYLFRQTILDAELSWIACGASVADWEKRAPLDASAEQVVFGHILTTVCDSAEKYAERVSFQFDRARELYVAPIIQSAFELSKIDTAHVNHGFSPVGSNAALQAADLVVHETYRYFVKLLADGTDDPAPHFVRLLEGAHDHKVFWFGAQEIDEMATAVEESLREKGLL